MRRRQFITLLGGAVVAWPVSTWAQQAAEMRRVGALVNLDAGDPEAQVRIGAFLQGLERAGWTLGRNLRIEYRWGAHESDRVRRYAAELVAFAPDAILAVGGTLVAALQQESRTVPIVFVSVADPVGAGHVASLARPGGNTTGFEI